MEKQKKGLAIAALVLGIIGLALSFLPIINNAAFIFGVIGLVLGVYFAKIRRFLQSSQLL